MSYRIIRVQIPGQYEQFVAQYHGFGMGREWRTLETFTRQVDADAWILERIAFNRALENPEVVATYDE